LAGGKVEGVGGVKRGRMRRRSLRRGKITSEEYRVKKNKGAKKSERM
jgi:hypothetical protein